MAPRPVIYVYRAIFPRAWDAARPDWRKSLLDDVAKIADVVDVAFTELSVAWHPVTGDTEVQRDESRRRVVELVAVSADAKAAEDARAAIRALILTLKAETAAKSVTFVRWPAELEVL